MLRRIALVSIALCAMSCFTLTDQKVDWYMISPKASADYPNGDINSDVATWQRIQVFRNADQCEEAEANIKTDDHPVDCIASNDRRLNPM